MADVIEMWGRALAVVVGALALAVVVARCSEEGYDVYDPYCGATPGCVTDYNSLPPTYDYEQE